ncbi:MAG: hypothetical protein HY518_00225 [Candidatus Aenigmarchaeota archaeon]|nr:hypothetical protein [Candidatus Aenigmarchaeota archaeon]
MRIKSYACLGLLAAALGCGHKYNVEIKLANMREWHDLSYGNRKGEAGLNEQGVLFTVLRGDRFFEMFADMPVNGKYGALDIYCGDKGCVNVMENGGPKGRLFSRKSREYADSVFPLVAGSVGLPR